jgi:hypothetical protein
MGSTLIGTDLEGTALKTSNYFERESYSSNEHDFIAKLETFKICLMLK